MIIKNVVFNNSYLKKIYEFINPTHILYSFSPEFAIKLMYLCCCGKTLNIKNPRTFNEKIQWMKLYDSTPLKTQLADKYLVQDWVKKTIGEEYLILLLGVWDDFDDIDFSSLPNKFVLKANHGSGWNIIVTDKSSFDSVSAKKKFDKWMKMNYGKNNLEPHYIPIVPKIIAEEYIADVDGNLPDYKIHCFNGKPTFIQYIGERNISPKEAFYDIYWNLMPFTRNYSIFETPIAKPVNLKEMISISKLLSESFIYVRIDLYVLNDDSIKFGEMTFTPAAGMGKWTPPEYDSKMGELILFT